MYFIVGSPWFCTVFRRITIRYMFFFVEKNEIVSISSYVRVCLNRKLFSLLIFVFTEEVIGLQRSHGSRCS